MHNMNIFRKQISLSARGYKNYIAPIENRLGKVAISSKYLIYISVEDSLIKHGLLCGTVIAGTDSRRS